MAEQTLSDARLFHRCAIQRFRESEVLFEAGYTTGAVYLGLGSGNNSVGRRKALNMAINIARGKSDRIIEGIVASLSGFEEKHPMARIDVYRQDSVSVRVRVIDPDFAGKTKSQRSQEIWNYLDKLPEELQSDISTILLLTPDEAKASFANVEFEDPVPSKL